MPLVATYKHTKKQLCFTSSGGRWTVVFGLLAVNTASGSVRGDLLGAYAVGLRHADSTAEEQTCESCDVLTGCHIHQGAAGSGASHKTTIQQQNNLFGTGQGLSTNTNTSTTSRMTVMKSVESQVPINKFTSL